MGKTPTPPLHWICTPVNIAVFDQDGQPVCNGGRVLARQHGREWYRANPVLQTRATLLPNGRFALVQGSMCNLYVTAGAEQDVPQACTETPLCWRVELDGCDPAEGTWSWQQNIAQGQTDISFYVPVRLRCTRTISPGDDAAVDVLADASDAADVPRD